MISGLFEFQHFSLWEKLDSNNFKPHPTKAWSRTLGLNVSEKTRGCRLKVPNNKGVCSFFCCVKYAGVQGSMHMSCNSMVFIGIDQTTYICIYMIISVDEQLPSIHMLRMMKIMMNPDASILARFSNPSLRPLRISRSDVVARRSFQQVLQELQS